MAFSPWNPSNPLFQAKLDRCAWAVHTQADSLLLARAMMDSHLGSARAVSLAFVRDVSVCARARHSRALKNQQQCENENFRARAACSRSRSRTPRRSPRASTPTSPTRCLRTPRPKWSAWPHIRDRSRESVSLDLKESSIERFEINTSCAHARIETTQTKNDSERRVRSTRRRTCRTSSTDSAPPARSRIDSRSCAV